MIIGAINCVSRRENRLAISHFPDAPAWIQIESARLRFNIDDDFPVQCHEKLFISIFASCFYFATTSSRLYAILITAFLLFFTHALVTSFLPLLPHFLLFLNLFVLRWNEKKMHDECNAASEREREKKAKARRRMNELICGLSRCLLSHVGILAAFFVRLIVGTLWRLDFESKLSMGTFRVENFGNRTWCKCKNQLFESSWETYFGGFKGDSTFEFCLYGRVSS